MQILSLGRFWCIAFADCAALENCVSVILNNERAYAVKYMHPVNSPLSILILSRFSLAVFLHGLTRSETTANRRACTSDVVTEKKMTLMQQHTWKTLAMLRHVFNNVSYVYWKRRCGKSNKTHNWNSELWKLVIDVKQ